MATIIQGYDDDIDTRCYGEELPAEIWIYIFIRLPVETLMQVICVCKHWYNLIKDPSFTCRHLQFQKMMSKISGHFLLQQMYEMRSLIMNYYLFDGKQEVVENPRVLGGSHYCETEQISSAMTYQNFLRYFPEKWFDSSLLIDGPINGLYCLHNYHINKGRFVIWNPATNEVGFLPFSEQCLPAGDYDKARFSLKVTGFGKDPTDEESYKVVIISHCLSRYGVRKYGMLYTTRTNTWRLLNDDLIVSHSRFDPCNKIYLNGFYYWMGEHQCTALVFDMSKKEVFLEISTPCHGTMALHNDHIALFALNKNQNEIDIWVMLEVSNWQKYIVLSVSGIQGRVKKPLGFWKTENEMLLVIDGSEVPCFCLGVHQTVLYNTATREIKSVGPKGKHPFKALDYHESLVSLSGRITKYKGRSRASLWNTVAVFLEEGTTPY